MVVKYRITGMCEGIIITAYKSKVPYKFFPIADVPADISVYEN